MDLEASVKELRSRVEKVSSSIVMIITYDNAGFEIGRASGCFIDNEGRIITNAYIIKNAYSAEVYSESNYYDTVKLLSREEALDFALLQVEAVEETPIALNSEHNGKPGDRVLVVGKLSASKVTVTEGIISAVSPIEGMPNLIEVETTKPITSFQSSKDGPLINIEGEVIGLTTMNLSHVKDDVGIPWAKYDERKFAVSMQSIKPLLSSQDKIKYLEPSGTKIWSRWFILHLKAKAILVFILLYNIGFPKMVAIVFACILVIALIQRLYNKFKIRINK
jgi:S1-C subfamily serine protease